MSKFFAVLGAILLFLSLAAGEFRIAATTDLHGNLRNLSALAPVIRQAKPDILVDAGDLVGGNLLAELDGGESMIKALNMLKYQFRIPGNHDFDQPKSDFLKQYRSFNGTTLGADWEWGGVRGVLCRVVRKGDFKVGVIGLTENAVARRHLPGPGAVRSHGWEHIVTEAMNKLRKEKVHCVVLIWHQGVSVPMRGAQQIVRVFPETDLVIGGHSHKENGGLRHRQTYFVQPGAHGRSASLVRIFYDDKTFKVDRIESALLRGDPRKTDPGIDALDKAAFQKHRKTIFQKVCRKGDLSARNFPGNGAEALRRAGGTQGAVFVSYFPDEKTAQGTQYRDLFKLLPYYNALCTVELTRHELRELLHDLQRNNRKFKRLTGVCGFQWTPGRGRRKGQVQAPEKITVTLSCYVMTSVPVLKRILHTPSRWKAVEMTEREALLRYFSRERAPEKGSAR